MLTIEKQVNDGEVNVISGDGYKIKINEPSPETIKGTIKFLNADVNEVLGNIGNRMTIIDLLCPQVGAIFKSGNIMFVDSSKNAMNGICMPPQADYVKHGVVGSVDLDNIGYAGDSTVRGTVNLKETTTTSKGTFIKTHLVVDFPTQACNGKFDKIYFSPYTKCTKRYPFGAGYLKFIPKINKVLDLLNFTQQKMSTMRVFQGLDNTIYTMDFASGDNNLTILKNGISTSYTQLQLGIIKPAGYTTLFNWNNEMYIYNSAISVSGPLKDQFIQKIIINNETDNVSLGAQIFLLDVLKNAIITDLTHTYIVDSVCLNNVNLLKIYYLAGGKWDNYFLILDQHSNVIKKITGKTYDLLGFTDILTFSKDDKIFYVIENRLYDYTFNDLGVYNISADSSYLKYRTNGVKNIMIGPLPDTPANFSRCEICEIATSYNGIIEITLTEPVNKTNAETLKLIFDMEISLD